ncbi:MAG: hypothetical protein AAF957_11390 [Planctomycetota bacterium]
MRAHLSHLDRAIVRLLDERARLARDLARDGAPASAAEPFTSDLLRRAEGDFPAEELREVFGAIERGCGRPFEGEVAR